MPRGYEYLARALHARGRPLEAIRSALKQSWSRQPQALREVVVLEDEALLAVVSGRFDEAERFALDLLKKQEQTSGQDDHTLPALLLIRIYEETGRLKEAGAVAEATRHGLDVWVRSLQATVMSDKAMELLDVSRRAGLLTPSAFEAERAAWLRGVEKEYPGTAPGTEWFVAYAQVASTPEEARAALDRMPDPRVVAPFVPLGLEWISVMGRLYWLAGRYDDALPYLREVTRDCCTLKVPFRNTRASYQLGEVLSAKGDKEGACGAYRVVLDRWGASKASVTAKAAAARVKALGCGK
jgi:tetratricopeptide (TPR) repeat protein